MPLSQPIELHSTNNEFPYANFKNINQDVQKSQDGMQTMMSEPNITNVQYNLTEGSGKNRS